LLTIKVIESLKFEALSTSCARGNTMCPARCTPDAAAQLQPIPYACGAQRALLPVAVGAMNINELMNINDVYASPPQYSHTPAS